ncbi:hypothetical protein HNY73_015554 [Argiope bruennichi]|uniref:DUF5641 domain-containing protein n=1 Tax=Argiope bruennichi TaxID=94029 RepID=A0A8T0EXX7_ARGBR|nr:hypothetical protein HNY73_015554 [Argiope bruennichi]
MPNRILELDDTKTADEEDFLSVEEYRDTYSELCSQVEQMSLMESEIEYSEKKLILLVQNSYLSDAKSSNFIETFLDNEENTEKLIPLTPSMFLIENKSSNTEDIEELSSKCLNKRKQYRNNLLKDLRQRFRKEYLGQLVRKHNLKHSPNPQVGEIVLVSDDNIKRLFLALAKIVEIIPGRDGKIRTVKLKTQHGKVLRPIQRIYPLKIYSNLSIHKEPTGEESNSHDVCHNENKSAPADDVIMRKYTSSGRCVKAPKKTRSLE